MAFPDGVQTVEVSAGTAGYRAPDGTIPAGSLRFTPSVSRVVSAEHGLIALGTVNAVLGASGEFTAELLAVDADGFEPSGWTYRVDEEFTNAPGRAWNISLPASTPLVALPSLAEVESDTGTIYAPAVLSVNGDTGVVTGLLEAANNLSDLNSPATARTSLGLGTSATRNVGTTTGTVAAGDDTRLTDARPPTAHAASHAAGGGDPVTLTQSQITGLAAALDALAPLAGATFTGIVTIDDATFLVLGDGKGFRFRPTGDALDLEAWGADFLISNWSGSAAGEGTQRLYFRLSADAQNTQLAGRFESVAGLYGGSVHALDPSTGVAELGAKNSLANIRLGGRRSTVGPPTTGTWAAGDTVQDAAGTWHLCTTGGTPGVWTSGAVDSVPSDAGLITWSYPPWAASSAGPGNSGFVYYMRVKIPTAKTVTGVRLYQTSPGATLTSGQCLVGLYDAAGSRAAVSADQSTAWASGSQINVDSAFTSPYAAAAGYYWAALLFNGTTGPSWSKGPPSGLMNAGWPSAPFPALISGSGQTALSASVTLSSLSKTVSAFWASLY